ncbi:MAG TPA: thiamine pyrophosphate-dependent dehydrogenase E1 component subunit alpha [Pseudonocardia sp.]
MSGLPSERLVELYTQMVRIREFEERVKRTFAEHPGVIRGHTHLADGAEASIVGSIAAIGEGDQLVATYRCHGYPIALGSDTAAMMAEIYGRSTGTCKGYGGSMHLADPARGFLGTSGIVGQNIPQGTGAAYAAQLRGRGEVVLTFFGDGASKQGAFHESLNIAAVWKLPVIFIMENNSFSATVRTEQEDANAAAGEPLSMKAKAYSIPGATIDGSDVLAVHEAVSTAVARARAGDGPTLIESRVYRLSAHGNSIAPPGVPLHYPEHEAISKYGAVEEYEAAKRGDPIPRLRAHLVETGTLTADRATEIIEAAQAEMQHAVEFGLQSPYPEPHEALAFVHA